MVHALHQAHRVLRSGGVLIDLRPAAVHRNVGIETAGRYRQLGVMREWFDCDHAADRAVATVVRHGLLEVEGRRRFPCHRSMDTMDEFRDWLDESVGPGLWPPHDWLVRRISRALDERRGRVKIVVRGPMDLCVLRKRAPARRRAGD